MGGCPAPAVTPREETSTVDVVFDRTGTLVRDVNFFSLPVSAGLFVGDNESNQPSCAFVSINLNSLPATANVTRVVLNLKATIDNGNGNPFGDFGAISVDHVNVVSGIGTSDYTGGTIEANVGTVPAFPLTARQDIAIDVTSQVNVDRAAGRPISSFRFRFDAAPSVDGAIELVTFEASDLDLNRRPSAVVTISL